MGCKCTIIKLIYKCLFENIFRFFSEVPFLLLRRIVSSHFLLNNDLNERVILYNSNPNSRVNNRGSYLIDENINGTINNEIGDPVFAFVQFRSNLVVRWEHIPGS